MQFWKMTAKTISPVVTTCHRVGDINEVDEDSEFDDERIFLIPVIFIMPHKYSTDI